MEKIDRRRHYLLVVDTETANCIKTEKGDIDTSSTLMYDCGWVVIDTKGTVYEKASYINSDIFCAEPYLMKTAYFAKKIPKYRKGIEENRHTLANTYQIRKAMLEHIEKYRIKEVIAHNARFDYHALNNIQRWVTKSKYRYWFPYNRITIWDSLKMAKSVILKKPTYKRFCQEYNLLTKTGRLSATAENLYKYMTGNPDYAEEHTALEDALIEARIVTYCYRQHKHMEKELWK